MTEKPETEIDDAAIEAARKLFAGACDFVAGAMTAEQLPPASQPHSVALGRQL